MLMIINQNIAQQTAEHLLQINAIKLNLENPFTWASGWRSPIYCDNRITLSFPAIRNFLSRSLAAEVKARYGSDCIIAGVATGAIGIGALVAHELNLPFIYVRPEPKKHGRQNQIEGQLQAGQKVVVIEDLISTGMSSLNAVKALQASQAEVLGMLALFTYGFDKAATAFSEAQVHLHTLCDYDTLLTVALQQKTIPETALTWLQEWRENPATWGPQ